MSTRTAAPPTLARPAKARTQVKPGGGVSAKPAVRPAPARAAKVAAAPKGATTRRAAAKPVVAAAPVAVAPPKPPKIKLVRDGFTMPEADHGLIGVLKKRALGFERPTRKSELLRAGLQALATLDDKRLKAALEALVPIKTGRPKKH